MGLHSLERLAKRESIGMKRKILAITAFLILIGVLIRPSSASGGLTCSITDSCSGTPVFYLKNSTGGFQNAHVQNASLGTYPYSVCCVPDSGSLGYGCQAVVLRLSNQTNAHAQAGNYSGSGDIYPVSVCLSSSAEEVQCFWGDSCGTDYECLASMAGANASLGNLTNAMLGSCGEYQTQVCCRISSASDIWFSPPTPQNQSSTNQDWILVNVSSEADSDSCLLDWHNGTWQNLSMAVDGRNCYLNVSGLGEGDYFYKAWVSSTSGLNATGMRKITVDFTTPDLWFSASTPANQSTTANNWITVNVTSNESLDACILEWHSTAWVNLTMSVDGNYCYKTMISLSQGYYYFRAHANDSAGNWNATEDRQIRYYVAPSLGNTGGSSGSGGSIQNLTSISASLTRNFSIDTDFIKVLVKQGETRNSSFTIKNTGNAEISLTSEVVSEGKYFVLDLPQNFTLAPNETRTANLHMLSLESMGIGVHTGTVYIRSGNMTKQISLVMEVSKKQGLFDVSLEIPSEFLSVIPGSGLSLQVRLTNLGDKKKMDMTATYVIKDMYDRQIVNQRETFAVETQASFIKNIPIPGDIKPGKYSAFVIVEYEDQAAVASSEFEVAGMERSAAIGADTVVWGIIGGFAAAITVLVAALVVVLRRRSGKQKRQDLLIRSEEDFHNIVGKSQKEYKGTDARERPSIPPGADAGDTCVKSVEEFRNKLAEEKRPTAQKPAQKKGFEPRPEAKQRRSRKKPVEQEGAQEPR